ncbi:hypothetical protein DFH06DRAFT_1090720 [Mycena polygramma]|nr:hypothetical protein DFH06DRAFT_1090720 [Mycena polygramma]
MHKWAVFVTEVHAPQKALNRAFLLLQDFEYGDYPASSQWALLSSKDLPAEVVEWTPLPPSMTDNDFASMSLAEINSFIRANESAISRMGVSSEDWLVIDRKGLETSTCLVCEQIYNYDEDEGEQFGEEGMTREFRACRIPYEEASGMVTNIEIANMDFTDWVDDNAGVQEDGSWRWMSFPPRTVDTEEATEYEVKREKALAELRDGGYID